MTQPTSVPKVSISTLTLPHCTQTMTLVILYFTDRIFLSLTNDGKIGCLYHCRPLSSIASCSLNETSSCSSLVDQRILGSWSPFHSIFATEVSQCFHSFHSFPVLVGFTLPTMLTYHAKNELEDTDEEEIEKMKKYQKDWLHAVVQEVKRVIASER